VRRQPSGPPDLPGRPERRFGRGHRRAFEYSVRTIASDPARVDGSSNTCLSGV
jgi:hypothetical protein